MATFTAIRNKTQNTKALRNAIDYVEQEKKTRWGDARLVTGHNCVPQSALAEMQMTKERFCKPGGTQFYHFVQSFSEDDDLTPQEANAIGLELVTTYTAQDGKQHVYSVEPFNVVKKEGNLYTFQAKHKLENAGSFKVSYRMFPKNADLPHRQDFCYVRWFI